MANPNSTSAMNVHQLPLMDIIDGLLAGAFQSGDVLQDLNNGLKFTIEGGHLLSDIQGEIVDLGELVTPPANSRPA